MPKTHKQILKRQREYARKQLAVRTEQERLLDNAKSRAYYQKNKKRLIEQVKQYKIDHPKSISEKKACYENNKEKFKDYRKAYYVKNKEKLYEYAKEYRLKKQFNLTIEEYNKMLESQNRCCAICGIHQDQLPHILGVDHNHTTGKIRELLCQKCNLVLGHAEDIIEILKRAIIYLEKHNIN